MSSKRYMHGCKYISLMCLVWCVQTSIKCMCTILTFLSGHATCSYATSQASALLYNNVDIDDVIGIKELFANKKHHCFQISLRHPMTLQGSVDANLVHSFDWADTSHVRVTQLLQHKQYKQNNPNRHCNYTCCPQMSSKSTSGPCASWQFQARTTTEADQHICITNAKVHSVLTHGGAESQVKYSLSVPSCN